MKLYPAAPVAVPVSREMVLAVPPGAVTTPLKSGRMPAGDESALVIAGSQRLRTGDRVQVWKLVGEFEVHADRGQRVRLKGSPAEHATLGPAEDWLEEQAGPGIIDSVAGRAALDPKFVKGERKRLLTRAFVIRAVVLMTLVPGITPREAVIALAGDLALLPWAHRWSPASERALADWRRALGPAPFAELAAIVHRAAWGEHLARDWRAVAIGKECQLRAGSIDGTLIRVPDTPANRAAFGSVGTGDDSAPWPAMRALPVTDASTRAQLALPCGAAGGDKAAAEQALLDRAITECPFLFTKDRIWLMDRNFPGTARIALLKRLTHFLIRLKSNIALHRPDTEILPDGSYIADLIADGLTVRVRVIEYCVTIEGRDVPEMFCLITDLTDIGEYPAADLAELYHWRWHGSETALREAKASLDGSGPGTGPMLRSGAPGLCQQELAAWAAGTEMTRGAIRDAALQARPAGKGRRAGLPVRPRDLSHSAGRRIITRAITAGLHACAAVTREITAHRVIADRNRHRDRKSKSPSTFPRGRNLPTIIAPAIITMANTPAQAEAA